MKKIVSFATLFAAIAILGTALIGAVPDKSPLSPEVSANSAKPCCQAKTSEAQTAASEAPKFKCCLSGGATSAAFAKTESDDADSSKVCLETNCDGDCSKCAAGNAVPAAKDEVKKCGSCREEDCQEECSSCAEARKEAVAGASDLVATADDHPETGSGFGKRMGHGHDGDSRHEQDHKDFFFLIEHRDSIRRTVKNIPNGVETLTESDVSDVASMIQVHVEAMYDRMVNVNPIRMRDPIFREVFANADKIDMKVEHTDQGVRVKETSEDAYVVKLLQEHAKVVSLWINNGYSELPKNHAAPQR